MSKGFTPENPKLEPVKYYGVFDDTGAAKGFFASDVNQTIPQTAVEISFENWSKLIEHQSFARYKNGVVTVLPRPEPPPPPPNPFDEIKAMLTDFGARLSKLEGR